MKMDNLEIYNKLKSVEKQYLKTIQAGRLKGMYDIKPQWRIMKMTEVFGVCGFGWVTENVQYHYETKGDEIVCNCRLDLLVKIGNEWSKPIHATGGSKFSTTETKGIYVSDEAEKMAYTDALSVAMKMLGVASDVYMGYSDSKYVEKEQPKKEEKKWLNPYTHDWINAVTKKVTIDVIKQHYSISKDNEVKYLNEIK